MTTYLRDFVQSARLIDLNECPPSAVARAEKPPRCALLSLISSPCLSARRVSLSLPPGVADVPGELRRHFDGIRELDLKVVELQRQVEEDCAAQLAAAAERQVEAALSSPSKRQRTAAAPAPAAAAQGDVELAERIEHNMNEVIKLSEEKMRRAQQAYDYIDQHIRKLDKDLKSFDADVAKERQKHGMPPVGPLGIGGEGAAYAGRGRRRGGTKAGALAAGPAPGTEGGPPLTSEQLYQAALAVSDEMEPTYCYCKRISFGEMIACEYPDCPIEWFHFECVGLTPENRPKGGLEAS